MSDPNWAEQVTAIATAIGVLATIGVAIVAGRQVREARHARQSQIAADFVRRWDEDALVETRRLVAQFETPHELRDACQRYIATNALEAYVLYREPDYFEQLGALERVGAVNFDLLTLLLGRRLVDRWEMWKPSAEGSEICVEGDDRWAARFTVALDSQWRHERTTVEVLDATGARRLELESDGVGSWLKDGRPDPFLEGCTDVDLAGNPFTNAFVTRRVAPPVGAEVEIRAAYIESPALSVRPLVQRYERVAADRWVYADDSGRFELTTDADGEIAQQHYAFLIGEDDFDDIYGRIRERGLEHWADPFRSQAGQINRNDGGRGVYFDDPDGHLLEVITRPYGSGG